MTNVDNRARVAAGVVTGGQFAEEAKSEPANLSLATAPSVPSIEEITDLVCADMGEGMRLSFDQAAAAPQTDEGREFLRRALAAVYHPDHLDPRRDSIRTYIAPEECDRYAELGYSDPAELVEKALRNFHSVYEIADAGIDKDRLDAVDALGLKNWSWTSWEKEALYGADVDDLLEIAAADPADHYRMIAALGGPEREARVVEAQAIGLTDKDLIENEQHPVRILKDILDAMPTREQNAHSVSMVASRGHAAENVKTYGAPVCRKFNTVELACTPLSPAQVRSLHSGLKSASLDGLEKLAAAGFTKGKEIREVSKAMNTENLPDLVAARRHATAEQLSEFRQVEPNKPMDASDAKAVGILVKNGIAKAEDLRPYFKGIYRQANWCVEHGTAALPVYASIVKAGITPERLGHMTRAGIPTDRVHEFATAEDLWEAGREFREGYAKDQERQVTSGWSRAAIPWEWDKDDYEVGFGY